MDISTSEHNMESFAAQKKSVQNINLGLIVITVRHRRIGCRHEPRPADLARGPKYLIHNENEMKRP